MISERIPATTIPPDEPKETGGRQVLAEDLRPAHTREV
jgi:hypothetical protein